MYICTYIYVYIYIYIYIYTPVSPCLLLLAYCPSKGPSQYGVEWCKRSERNGAFIVRGPWGGPSAAGLPPLLGGWLRHGGPVAPLTPAALRG